MVKLTCRFRAERARWLYPIGSSTGAVLSSPSQRLVRLLRQPARRAGVAVTRMGSNGETKEPFIPRGALSNLPEALAPHINAAYVNLPGRQDRIDRAASSRTSSSGPQPVHDQAGGDLRREGRPDAPRRQSGARRFSLREMGRAQGRLAVKRARRSRPGRANGAPANRATEDVLRVCGSLSRSVDHLASAC